MNNKQKTLRIIGISVLATSYLCFLAMITIGAINSDFKVNNDFNKYGEGWIELIMMWTAIPYTYIVFKEYLELIKKGR